MSEPVVYVPLDDNTRVRVTCLKCRGVAELPLGEVSKASLQGYGCIFCRADFFAPGQRPSWPPGAAAPSHWLDVLQSAAKGIAGDKGRVLLEFVVSAPARLGELL